jgi:hypothetical protein
VPLAIPADSLVDRFCAPDPWLLAGAAVVVVLAMIHAAIRRNLPVALRLTPIDDDSLCDTTSDLASALQQVGFERLGPALQADLRPPVALVVLVHRQIDRFATIYELRQPRLRVFHEFVSSLDREASTLTTVAAPEAATLPLAPRELMQVIRHADTPALHAAHEAALAHLRTRGIRPYPLASVTPDDLLRLLREAILRKRQAFLARPIQHTFVALGRAIRRRSPHETPIATQAYARAQIDAIAALPARR